MRIASHQPCGWAARVGVCFIAMLTVSSAPAESIHSRVVTVDGDPNYPDLPSWESSIGPSPTHVVKLSIFGERTAFAPPDNSRIHYAVATLNQGAWSWNQEGIIGDPNVRAGDPVVAYDPVGDDFVAVSLLYQSGALYLYQTRWNPDVDSFPLQSGWQVVESGAPSGDRPWLVAGEMSASIREFYLTYNADGSSSGDSPHYYRSTDGGFNWVGGPVTIDGQQL